MNTAAKSIDVKTVHEALTALGRSINMVSTYGNEHPAFVQSIDSAHEVMQKLFTERKKISIGAVKGALTVDGSPFTASGVLLKSLKHRLTQLEITGLQITRKITRKELARLVELLACKDAGEFNAGIGQASLSHITAENTRYEAVQEDELVASKADLAGAGGSGVLVIEDDISEAEGGSSESSVQVDQIVAFLKGDVEGDAEGVGDELAELASNPDRLGQMIMESVAIRQTTSELAGESLSDVVLGCLRRTYEGLRKQPAFQESKGIASLQKSLLLLEESMLEKMRILTGEPDPELDRQIVQAVREMDENLGFEQAAAQYVEHHEALEESKAHLKSYVQTNGIGEAEELLANTDFPPSEWKRIVVESRKKDRDAHLPIAAGLNTLSSVFEKLESLMKSNETDESRVKALLGEASENLGVSLDSTKEKLQTLSKQLDDTGTIGGQGKEMSRKELLSSIAEISQELMQPLTAISASVEMMIGGYVGEVTLDQRDMLGIANNSSTHLTFLMKELIAIVGCPTNKGVDERFHTTSEKVVLLEKKQG